MRSRSEVLEMLQQELNSADQQKQVRTTRLHWVLEIFEREVCYKSSQSVESTALW